MQILVFSLCISMNRSGRYSLSCLCFPGIAESVFPLFILKPDAFVIQALKSISLLPLSFQCTTQRFLFSAVLTMFSDMGSDGFFLFLGLVRFFFSTLSRSDQPSCPFCPGSIHFNLLRVHLLINSDLPVPIVFQSACSLSGFLWSWSADGSAIWNCCRQDLSPEAKVLSLSSSSL